MSRKVDRRKPLSDSDRAYLESRGLRTDVYPVARAERASESEQDQERVPEVDPEVGPEDEGDDYDEWTVADLRAELKDRQLEISGNKPELMARLREHDAANPE